MRFGPTLQEGVHLFKVEEEKKKESQVVRSNLQKKKKKRVHNRAKWSTNSLSQLLTGLLVLVFGLHCHSYQHFKDDLYTQSSIV